jgi:hypothetical protein
MGPTPPFPCAPGRNRSASRDSGTHPAVSKTLETALIWACLPADLQRPSLWNAIGRSGSVKSDRSLSRNEDSMTDNRWTIPASAPDVDRSTRRAHRQSLASVFCENPTMSRLHLRSTWTSATPSATGNVVGFPDKWKIEVVAHPNSRHLPNPVGSPHD